MLEAEKKIVKCTLRMLLKIKKKSQIVILRKPIEASL